MKDIDLVKRKKDSAITGLTDAFEPGHFNNREIDALSCVVDLLNEVVEKLEAAQRAEGAAKTRIAELERQWEFRAPTPDAYEATCKALEKHRQRAEAAEAELKRRDAQEPVGWQFKSANGDWLGLIGEDGKNQAVKEGCEVRPVYAAAPAVVLPPEKDCLFLLRSFVTDADIAALHRFAECCDDPESGGHDLERSQVLRLENIGALQRSGRVSYITGFGDHLISITSGVKWVEGE